MFESLYHICSFPHKFNVRFLHLFVVTKMLNFASSRMHQNTPLRDPTIKILLERRVEDTDFLHPTPSTPLVQLGPSRGEGGKWSYLPRASRFLGRPAVASFSQLIGDMDNNLFAKIQHNPHHVLYKLLPEKTDHNYNLRPRSHSFTLSVKTDSRNYINKMLFKDIY